MIRSVHHICIETWCYNDSLHFYCSVLGFSVVEETENFHGREYCTWIKNGGVIIELQTPKRGLEAVNGNSRPGTVNHICFTVDNLSDAINMLTGAGFNSFRSKEGKIIYNVKGGDLAKITAPEGTVIELREPDHD